MINKMKNLVTSLFAGRQLVKHDDKRLAALMKIINYDFTTDELLSSALAHTSISGKDGETSIFERMEFLGDSVLGLIIAEAVFEKFPDYAEGQLSKLKAKVVSRDFLATIARNIGLGSYLQLSREAEKVGGRNNSSILADTMEAVICAIYLDGGINCARKFIIDFIFKDYKKVLNEKDLINYKSKLQEHTQLENQELPNYILIDESGPDHNKTFSIEVEVHGKIMGTGVGHTKKEAQQKAAKEACNNLKI